MDQIVLDFSSKYYTQYFSNSSFIANEDNARSSEQFISE